MVTEEKSPFYHIAYCPKCEKDVKIDWPGTVLGTVEVEGKMVSRMICPECGGIVYFKHKQ